MIDASAPAQNTHVYLSAENPEQTISKPELQSLVQRLAKGLRKVAQVKDGDVVLLFAGNSVSYWNKKFAYKKFI